VALLGVGGLASAAAASPAALSPTTASATAASAAAAGELRLPTPAASRTTATDLCRAVGCARDRVLRSVVPGPVTSDEVVLVGLAGDGRPASVVLEQRLVLTGQGDYQVRERGPARSAVALGEEPPPVTKLGAVVWQGFSPGRRELAARLGLDPALEEPRLPLKVAVRFVAPGQASVPLGPGGRVPGAGTVTVTVSNSTAQPADLPTARDAPAAALAGPLDAARLIAAGPAGPRLPTPGAGLPVSLPATGVSTARATAAVPLRLSGTVSLEGAPARLTGPGTTPDNRVAGTLPGGGAVEFALAVDGPGALTLDLTAAPALDPRTLVPPGNAASWRAWAAAGPPLAERRTALDLLVQVAATGARASAYSPYLGADLPGTGRTAFRYAVARRDVTAAGPRDLTPQPGAIAVSGLAALLVLAAGTGVWRQS
jgi:hypothetical protein